jgi:hypothetical protein
VKRLTYTDENLANLRAAFGDLTDKPIFTVWSHVHRDGKWTKKPEHPSGCPGMTFKRALELFEANKSLAGLGVKFGLIPGTKFILWGLDYDAEKGPLPEPRPKTETYAERSPSGGENFHVLGVYEGTPLEGRRQGAVEIYTDGRFFTLTGERINGAQIIPTDPRPFYAAIGVLDPQPYGAPTALSVKAAPIKESDLTERERKLHESVRGIANDDLSARDFAVCSELIARGATDEEVARVLCAGFWRDKLGRNKKYVASTIRAARESAGPSEAEAAQSQAAAVERLKAKARAFRDESKAIGEGSDETAHYPKILDVDDLLVQAVFISDGSQVALRADPRIAWSLPDFENLFAASGDVYTGKKGRPISVVKAWLRDPQRITVHTRTFRAGGPLFCQSPADTKALNTWREPPRITPPVDWPARVKPLLDHIDFLVPNVNERACFLDWLAHIEQRPGDLPHFHFLFFTAVQGIGRNWLSSLLAWVWPGVVALDVELDKLLDGGFNGRLSRKILVVVNEVREGRGMNAYRHADTLRGLLTNATRNINPKYGREYDEFNSARWLMFSNHEGALPLDRFDRRIYAIQNPDAPRNASYYAKLYAMLDDRKFTASVRELLRQRDISKFNPGMHAPLTATKQRVIDAGRSDAELQLAELVESHPRDCITTSGLTKCLWGDHPSPKDLASLPRICERAGVRPYSQQVWLVMGDSKVKARVRILRNCERWLTATASEVAEEVLRPVKKESGK